MTKIHMLQNLLQAQKLISDIYHNAIDNKNDELGLVTSEIDSLLNEAYDLIEDNACN